MTSDSSTGWRPLGRVSPQTLAATRLDLHWAVQIPTAGAITLLTHRPDYSHTALEWSPTLGALLTQPIEQVARVRIGLRLADLTVILVGSEEEVRAEFALEGRTLREGYEALGRSISEMATEPVRIQPSDYSLPDHTVKTGGRFSADSPRLQEFANLYHNADRSLRAYRAQNPRASAPVVWPHHFDMAVLSVLDPEEPDAEKARSIGVGVSPGDETYAEPYAYVLPWPHLDPAALPELGSPGHWHTDGFVAAVLTASAWWAETAEDEPASRLDNFVQRAVFAARRGLGADG